MLKILHEEHKQQLSKPKQHKPKIQHKPPLSESFSDLKYLSSFCYTNFNGAFPKSSCTHIVSNHNNDISAYNNNNPNNINNFINNENIILPYNKKPKINNNNSNTSSCKYAPHTMTKQASNTKLKCRVLPKQKTTLYKSSSQPNKLNLSVSSMTQLHKVSSLTNLADFKDALNELQVTYLDRLRTKLSDNNNTHLNLSNSVIKLSKDLRDLNREYDKSKEHHSNVLNQSMKLSCDLKRLLMQNKNISELIDKDKNESDLMRQQINELDEDKINKENEIDDINMNIIDMKKQIKLLHELINKGEEDKKNLMSAILIVQRKSDEIRNEIFKMDNNRDYVGQDLENMIQYYKTAKV